ncbi:MAG TPA: hypothetical protein VKB57_02005 [Acidimicrobiales bacterium]|nr:hypothetical protein [Acidimicrobiales bacterium]
MTGKVVRFHDGDPSTAAALADAWRAAPDRPGAPERVAVAACLTLPGLPPPRYAAVDMIWGAAAPVGRPVLTVPVEEDVRRGAVGGERYAMMSVARRRPGLSRAGFAARWRAEAGRLGAEAIPADVRGAAYVQDHPVGDDPPVDAVNEAWFADLDGLRRRAEWFAARPVPPELFDPARSFPLYLRWEPL